MPMPRLTGETMKRRAAVRADVMTHLLEAGRDGLTVRELAERVRASTEREEVHVALRELLKLRDVTCERITDEQPEIDRRWWVRERRRRRKPSWRTDLL